MDFFSFLVNIQAAVLRIVYHLSLKKGIPLAVYFSSIAVFLPFVLVIASQSEYKAAEKEQGLGEKSVEMSECLLFIYSLRCRWSYLGCRASL